MHKGGRKKEYDRRLAISFTDDQIVMIRTVARELNVTFSDVIRLAINKLFGKNKGASNAEV